jgi:hypothetical protein
MNVISRPIGATTEFSTIVKVRMYRKFHERHDFISIVMEVHNTYGCDTNHFIKECACFFHGR